MGKARQLSIYHIMFDEERLDPQGVGNLPHVLTRIKKLSTLILESEEKLSGCITGV